METPNPESNAPHAPSPCPGQGHDPVRAKAVPPVTIISAQYLEQVQLPRGGTSVGALRRRFGRRLDIDPASIAVVGGRKVSNAARIGPGATINFIRLAGEITGPRAGRTAGCPDDCSQDGDGVCPPRPAVPPRK